MEINRRIPEAYRHNMLAVSVKQLAARLVEVDEKLGYAQANYEAQLAITQSLCESTDAKISHLSSCLRRVLTSGARQDMSVKENRDEFDTAIAEAWGALHTISNNKE